MWFGGSVLAKCPHCRNYKPLMKLLSGNTYGAEIWSDGRMIAPMCPELSPIQKCQHCGHYFFLSKVDTYKGEDSSDEAGWLSLDEAKEVIIDLGNMNIIDWSVVFLISVWAYNDIFRNGGTPTDENKEWFMNLLQRNLELPNIIEDDLICAELFREIGERKRCQDILLCIHHKDKWHYNIGREIARRCAYCADTNPFRVDLIQDD